MRRCRWPPGAWASTSASITRSGSTRRWPIGRRPRSTRRGRSPGRGSADAHRGRRRPLLALTLFGLPAVLTMGTILLIRPTLREFNAFVHVLDKFMSENINKNFFGADVSPETERPRKDGKIVVTQKGTIQLL